MKISTFVSEINKASRMSNEFDIHINENPINNKSSSGYMYHMTVDGFEGRIYFTDHSFNIYENVEAELEGTSIVNIVILEDFYYQQFKAFQSIEDAKNWLINYKNLSTKQKRRF